MDPWCSLKKKKFEGALETIPAAFTVEARNPSPSIRIGELNYVMAPGYGPPFIIEPTGQKRAASLVDVEMFCKLVQTSRSIDFNSAIPVQPHDVPVKTAHLDILVAVLTLIDWHHIPNRISIRGCSTNSRIE